MPLVTDLSLSTDQRIYTRPSRMPPRTACLLKWCVWCVCVIPGRDVCVCVCVLTAAQPLTVTHLEHMKEVTLRKKIGIKEVWSTHSLATNSRSQLYRLKRQKAFAHAFHSENGSGIVSAGRRAHVQLLKVRWREVEEGDN